MISSLRGRVVHLEPESIVLDVHGVGYAVAVTSQHARRLHLGDEVFVHTSLIVREDAMSLFGFESRSELDVFGHLLSVSGVGPKSALGVLSSLTVDQIAGAVAGEDDAPFRRVSGIGPKTAKLIVVQLAGKLTAPATAATASVPPAGLGDQVVAALVALGWSERIATEAAAAVVDDAPAGATVPALLKLALAQLGPARKERTGV
ncbi:Holliday junction branch migration protein RuvA [Microbacterium sp. EYE_5]|uniref:Holliday junction branch migration protein RuvA n=1 Tax=unclassified Microbacterium TaxID=2609290 RepID=UPI00200690B8|nr:MULTISPECIES: Holliday junction branch migration protein RuvA [unclassified Microbacterium]MCK6080705.1 Holliday junction branch migration protein RuvA [Microbacterium sp. EYE_382]MCK6085976.1 Holliday junction branch migration protein RuvA [Microbacterium sp. EYE_384]MCK6124526.1 Holliday junction branch migration protein RuvA [Microbacterium sp. EYE_80]MCK6127435.1 Holliday junction branch migration protein RuvA [Microbacterium sp. EYE_79]MCK6141660.1 Holliday junction branch migration pr